MYTLEDFIDDNWEDIVDYLNEAFELRYEPDEDEVISMILDTPDLIDWAIEEGVSKDELE